MANVTRERQGQLLRELFAILAEHPEGLQAKDALAELESRVELTPYEASDYPNNPGIRRFEKTVRFATISPTKAGWMLKRKGVWTVTEDGRKAYQSMTDPADFLREAVHLYRKWKESIEPPDPDDVEEVEAGGAAVTVTIEEAEEAAWQEIAAYLAQINPYDFQDLVGALLEGMGYHVLWTAEPGPDQGFDLVAFHDPLGTSSPRIKVQVKRRGDRISVDELRSFLAVLADGDVGIFVSTGGFTRDAFTEARTHQQRRVTLVDQVQLFDLWVEHYERIDEAKRGLLPLRIVHYLARDS